MKGSVFSPPSVRPVPARGREARKRNPSIASIPTPVFFARLSDNGISVFGGASSSSMGRPTFAGRIQNVTVNVGKEAVLACPVNNIGKYKVRHRRRLILYLHSIPSSVVLVILFLALATFRKALPVLDVIYTCSPFRVQIEDV